MRDGTSSSLWKQWEKPPTHVAEYRRRRRLPSRCSRPRFFYLFLDHIVLVFDRVILVFDHVVLVFDHVVLVFDRVVLVVLVAVAVVDLLYIPTLPR
ncbi:unnamed protein product, partial [Hymenolepis diminuta]|uniref:Uncharacterized protein n=1 Tax=Hymenolepis diminuta TaxID=6216 RepID=A0A0R3SBU0_HYMDI